MTMFEEPQLQQQWFEMTAPMREDLPTGPVTEWTEAEHLEVRRMLVRCEILGIMAFAAPNLGTPEQVQLMAALYANMAKVHIPPRDYAGYEELVTMVRQQRAALMAMISADAGGGATP